MDEATEFLRRSKQEVRQILSDLAAEGYLVRLARGRYMALDPYEIATMVGSKFDLSRIKQVEYRPLLQKTLAELLRMFHMRLVSVVLYGSMARGTAGPNSDIDLLIVIRNLPSDYFRRAELLTNISVAVSPIKTRLWKDRGVYATLDMIALTPEEANRPRLLYLDMVTESVILFDREDYFKRVIELFHDRLEASRVRRVVLPSGKSYWAFPPEILNEGILQ